MPKRLRGLARRLAGPERWGANALRVPWGKVDAIDAALHLCCKAEELSLRRGLLRRLRGPDPDARGIPWANVVKLDRERIVVRSG